MAKIDYYLSGVKPPDERCASSKVFYADASELKRAQALRRSDETPPLGSPATQAERLAADARRKCAS